MLKGAIMSRSVSQRGGFDPSFDRQEGGAQDGSRSIELLSWPQRMGGGEMSKREMGAQLEWPDSC